MGGRRKRFRDRIVKPERAVRALIQRWKSGYPEVTPMTPSETDQGARLPAGPMNATVLRSAGMRTLLDDGKAKIRRGMTTPEEIMSVTQVEELIAE